MPTSSWAWTRRRPLTNMPTKTWACHSEAGRHHSNFLTISKRKPVSERKPVLAYFGSEKRTDTGFSGHRFFSVQREVRRGRPPTRRAEEKGTEEINRESSEISSVPFSAPLFRLRLDDGRMVLHAGRATLLGHEAFPPLPDISSVPFSAFCPLVLQGEKFAMLSAGILNRVSPSPPKAAKSIVSIK